MKTLVRTTIILAAALAVVGGLYVFRQSDYARSLSMFRGGHGPGDRGGFDRGAFEGARPERGRGGRVSIFGAGEVIKNLLIMGVITAGVVLVTRGRKPAARRRESGGAQSL